MEVYHSASIDSLQSTIDDLSSENNRVISVAHEYEEKIVGLNSEVAQLRHSLEHASTSIESVEELGKVSGELEILRRRVRETAENKALEIMKALNKIEELEEQVRQGESQRRKLHNVIQELRGNIRVFARVRPFLPSDGIDMSVLPEPSIVASVDGSSLKIKNSSADEKVEEHAFTFDKVFGAATSQESIYEEVSEFVQSALDGYNVCLFSYGQTGSGKVLCLFFH